MIRKRKRMTKTQFQDAIDTLGVSQIKASQLLGVNRKTAPRWARGESPIPHVVASLLRVMIHHKLTPEHVSKLE